MVAGDKYRARALELLAQADTAADPDTRAKFENLAAAFLRLAMQAERNTELVIDFELPSEDTHKPNNRPALVQLAALRGHAWNSAASIPQADWQLSVRLC